MNNENTPANFIGTLNKRSSVGNGGGGAPSKKNSFSFESTAAVNNNSPSESSEEKLKLTYNAQIPFTKNGAEGRIKSFSLVDAFIRACWKLFTLSGWLLYLSVLYFLARTFWIHATDVECVPSKLSMDGTTMNVICQPKSLNPGYVYGLDQASVILMSSYQNPYLFSRSSDESPPGLYAFSADQRKTRRIWPHASAGQVPEGLYGSQDCSSPPYPYFNPTAIHSLKFNSTSYAVVTTAYSHPMQYDASWFDLSSRRAVEIFILTFPEDAHGDIDRMTTTWVGCAPLNHIGFVPTAVQLVSRNETYSDLIVGFQGKIANGKGSVSTFEKAWLHGGEELYDEEGKSASPFAEKAFGDPEKHKFQLTLSKIVDAFEGSLTLVYKLLAFWLGSNEGFLVDFIPNQDAVDYEPHVFGSAAFDISGIYATKKRLYFTKHMHSEFCSASFADPEEIKCVYINDEGKAKKGIFDTGSLESLTFWKRENKFILLKSDSYTKSELCAASGLAHCSIGWKLYSIDPRTMEYSKIFEHDGSAFGAASSISMYKNKVIIGSKNSDRFAHVSIKQIK